MSGKDDESRSKAPSATLRATDKSTLENIEVSEGNANLSAANQSAIKGVKIGATSKADTAPTGWQWWLEKVGVPLTVAIIGLIAVVLGVVATWHFGLLK